MGIDGIGKPGGAGGVPGAGVAPAGGAAGESFRVERSADSRGVEGHASLRGLERGEINLDQYLDARADEAVRHLVEKLPAEQLEFVRQSLREQLATDPVLVELVRRTTGRVPDVRND
jgi:hypothetical protein